METLRRAMSGEKSPRSAIQLVVARRFDDQPQTPTLPRSLLSSPSSDKSMEIGMSMYQEHEFEWDRNSIKVMVWMDNVVAVFEYAYTAWLLF